MPSSWPPAGPGRTTSERRPTGTSQAYLAENQFLLPLVWRDEVAVVRDAVLGPTVRRLGDPADRYYDVLTWRLADDR